MSTGIVKAYPPNFEKIKERFPIVETKKGIVYTYGNILFNPDDGEIDTALLIHEHTHSVQQGTDNEKIKEWWNKYLSDDKFRLEQELEAYRAQYKYFVSVVKDRNQQFRYLNILAGHLSSEQYGGIISRSDAIREIKR